MSYIWTTLNLVTKGFSWNVREMLRHIFTTFLLTLSIIVSGCDRNRKTETIGAGSIEKVHNINDQLLANAGNGRNLNTYDQVCETVSEKFFDPEFNGVDWEELCSENRSQAADAKSRAELAALLNTMLAKLKTSHTAFYTPDDKYYYLLFDVFGHNPNLDPHRKRLFGHQDVSFEGIGVFTVRFDDETYISSIVEGSPASAADIKVGDIILAVDDSVFHPIRSFLGKSGQTVDLKVRSTLNEPARNVKAPSKLFQNAMKNSARIIETEGVKIGYIHIWSSAGQEYEDILGEVIQAGPLSQADAIIVDMRGKIGGGGLNYLNVLNQHSLNLTVKGRGFSVDQTASFKGKTVWIIDKSVRSSAELLAYAIRKDGFGPMIGERTAGAVTGGSPSLMADDGLLYVAVADLWVDGVRLEGKGVEPDIFVQYPIPYSAGIDPQFNRALEEAIKLVSP